MSDQEKGLNLPAIKKGGDLSKVKKAIPALDLGRKSSVGSILNAEPQSIQKEILKAEVGLDLVLVGDLTTSMMPYHELLKGKFKELCRELFSMVKNMRIGIVFYLDHDGNLPYVTKVAKLTNDIEQLHHFIETTPVSHGGNTTFDEA